MDPPISNAPRFSRKRILLIASTTGYQATMFMDAAEAAGYDLTLATDRCHVLDDPWGDRALPLRFDDPPAAVEAAASVLSAQTHVDGITAVGDRPAYLAAMIAERLALPFHSVEFVSACRNKYRMRSLFHQAGLLVPDFYCLPLDAVPADASTYPCVLKPLGLSASRGVIRANNAAEFQAAFERIRLLLDAPDIRRMRDEQDGFIQVESFIPGREFALEGIVTQGELHVIALFDKPDPLDGPFFEETIYVTPSRASAKTQEAIRRTTERAVQALGPSEGPVHAEMRVNKQGVWMLEVAARPIGGLCARVLPSLPELILSHSVGDFMPKSTPSNAAGVMMIPIPRGGIYHGVCGVDAARSVPHIEDVIITAKEGQRLEPLPEGNTYLGFIFARGDDPAAVEAALRAAHARLAFEIVTALPVML